MRSNRTLERHFCSSTLTAFPGKEKCQSACLPCASPHNVAAKTNLSTQKPLISLNELSWLALAAYAVHIQRSLFSSLE